MVAHIQILSFTWLISYSSLYIGESVSKLEYQEVSALSILWTSITGSLLAIKSECLNFVCPVSHYSSTFNIHTLYFRWKVMILMIADTMTLVKLFCVVLNIVSLPFNVVMNLVADKNLINNCIGQCTVHVLWLLFSWSCLRQLFCL